MTIVDEQTMTVTESNSTENLFKQKISEWLKGGYHQGNINKLAMSEVEKILLGSVMKHTRGNQVQATKILGMARGTLRQKLQQYGMDKGNAQQEEV